MKLVIAGSRSINDYQMLLRAVKKLPFEVTEVVSGGAVGADRLGEKWAASKGIPIKRMPAKWNVHGLTAGPIRNREMAEYADAAIVLWDTTSNGSRNMINEMHRVNKPVWVEIPVTPLEDMFE